MGNTCCKKKRQMDDIKTHQRNSPSTVSYDFDRAKGQSKALKDLEKAARIARRKPIYFEKKTIGPRRDAGKR